MDYDDIRKHALEVAAEMRETQERINADQEHLTALLFIMKGYEKLYPELRDLRINIKLLDAPRPKGQTAVYRVMESEPERMWTVQEMVYALDERGWLPDSPNPAGAVRTAFERLYKAHRASKSLPENGPVAYRHHDDRFGFGDWEPDDA